MVTCDGCGKTWVSLLPTKKKDGESVCDDCFKNWNEIKKRKDTEQVEALLKERRIQESNSQWEYKFVSVDTPGNFWYSNNNKDRESQTGQINTLGFAGWELVAVVPLREQTLALGSGGAATHKVVFVFKRKMPKEVI